MGGGWAAAGVPEAVAFATKPELAMRMLERAFAAGITPAWVVADAVYGESLQVRRMLETGGHLFVLAVSGRTYLRVEGQQHRISDLLTELHEEAETVWQQLSVGDGAKGPRDDDWLRIPLQAPEQAGSSRWLLVRRSGEDREDLTAYLAVAPSDTRLAEHARAAGSRWQVEIGFEMRRARWASTRTRSAVGMAGTGISRWRWWPMPCWQRCGRWGRSWRPRRGGDALSGQSGRIQAAAGTLVALTVAEVRRLVRRLLAFLPSWDAVWYWSAWRRRHLAIARACHDRKRNAIFCEVQL